MSFDLNLISETDPVSGTIANIVRAYCADELGADRVTISDPYVLGTGGGCSAAIVNVSIVVDGSPVLSAQLVLWCDDVAPSSPWLPTTAAFYVGEEFYDYEHPVTGETTWDHGSPEPLTVWDGDNSPELLAAMLRPLIALIDGAAELVENPATGHAHWL